MAVGRLSRYMDVREPAVQTGTIPSLSHGARTAPIANYDFALCCRGETTRAAEHRKGMNRPSLALQS